MPKLTIDPAALPSKQFTAGSLLKEYKGAKLAEVREALDALVDAGTLTVKVAKSGARNYAQVKGATRPAVDSPPEASTTSEPAAVASDDKVERVALAKQEAAALKAWQANPDGDRPATPNLDAINNGTKAKAPSRTRKATADTGPRGTTVRFLHDGKPMPDSQNKLSSVAWYYTKGVGGTDVPRISVTALRNLLAAEGIDDPANTPGWSVTLDNGIVLSTTAL